MISWVVMLVSRLLDYVANIEDEPSGGKKHLVGKERERTLTGTPTSDAFASYSDLSLPPKASHFRCRYQSHPPHLEGIGEVILDVLPLASRVKGQDEGTSYCPQPRVFEQVFSVFPLRCSVELHPQQPSVPQLQQVGQRQQQPGSDLFPQDPQAACPPQAGKRLLIGHTEETKVTS